MTGVLGVPNEYEVFIVDSLTQQTVDVVPWSSISWGRTMNGVSRAQVQCRRQRSVRPKWYDLQPLRAWDRMLVIVRDGFRVWDGPILGWSNSAGGLSIEAVDRSIALSKRLLSTDLVLSNAAVVYKGWTDLLSPAITNSGLLTTGAGQMPYTMTTVTNLSSPLDLDDIRPTGVWRFSQLMTLASLFDQMGTSTFFGWTQDRENLRMFIDRYGAFVNASTRAITVSGTLRPEYITTDTGDVAVTARADDLATGVYKGDTGQGIAGFPNSVVPFNTLTYTPYALYGVLADSQTADFEWYNEAGTYKVDPQQYVAPCPTLTLEAVRLASTYYLDDEQFLTDLNPGRVLRLDFPNSWSLNTPIVSRVPAIDTSFIPTPKRVIRTVYSDRIQFARIDDLSVTVQRDGTSVSESMTMSLTARASS